MATRIFFTSGVALCIIFAIIPSQLNAQETSLDARTLQPTATVSFSPRTASYVEGSVFEIPVTIDTDGHSVNSMEIIVQFDPKKIAVVKPSGGTSIIGLWIEPPSFDNTKGTVRFLGAIPGGIKANSGIIATITFRALQAGDTTLRFSSESQVLLNDGYGTSVNTTFGRGFYSIATKPPEGVAVFSETHPSPSTWYNNNSPSFSWDQSIPVDGYSYTLDTSPYTVPDNTITSTDSKRGYEGLHDGEWYFHLKARKNGVWGNTTHFHVKIDTAPPAEFTPRVDYIATAASLYTGLVSFETTDALSGIHHYEVGALDSVNTGASPVFIQTESPYRVPTDSKNMRVIVRAFDAAGNTRDTAVDVNVSTIMALIVQNAWNVGLSAIVIILLALFGIHYLIAHHVLRHMRDAYRYFRKEQTEDQVHVHDEVVTTAPSPLHNVVTPPPHEETLAPLDLKHPHQPGSTS